MKMIRIENTYKCNPCTDWLTCVCACVCV